MLYRKIESLIEEHLKSDSKKILLIDGARQIGKTYIINQDLFILAGVFISKFWNVIKFIAILYWNVIVIEL